MTGENTINMYAVVNEYNIDRRTKRQQKSKLTVRVLKKAHLYCDVHRVVSYDVV